MSVQTDIRNMALERPTEPGAAVGQPTDMAGSGRRSRKVQQRRFGPILFLSILASAATLPVSVPSVVVDASSISLVMLSGTAAMYLVALTLFSLLGRARDGALVSVVGLVVLLTWSVGQTGGLSSPLMILFAFAPVEAFLTGRRRFLHSVTLLTVGGVVAASALATVIEQTYPISPTQVVLFASLGVFYALSVVARVVKANRFRNIRAQATHRAIQQLHHVTHDVFLLIERDAAVGQVYGAVRSVLDCDGTELRGNGLFDRIHVSDRPTLLTALDEVHTSRGRAKVDARVKAGQAGSAQHFLWVEIDLSMTETADGQGEIFALIRDVTAVKDHASALTQAREKAEASDAAKGRFLATMSHELRTPLNAIIGFADILSEDVFGALANEQQREYVGLIRDSGGHLLQLVNDLLDMSKLDAGHFQIVPEPFRLDQVVERCARLVGQQLDQAGLTLRIDLPEDLPELVADQRAVRQMLINLLSNACKFTPTGGTITMRARQDGQMMVLTISDTGIGIAAQDLQNIGQPFYQANGAYDRGHQGTGLGLSVVKGLCELHDGSMNVRSLEGEGTSVSLCLPLAGPKETSELARDGDRAAQSGVLAKLDSQRSKATQPLDEEALDAALEAHDTPAFEQKGKRAHG